MRGIRNRAGLWRSGRGTVCAAGVLAEVHSSRCTQILVSSRRVRGCECVRVMTTQRESADECSGHGNPPVMASQSSAFWIVPNPLVVRGYGEREWKMRNVVIVLGSSRVFSCCAIPSPWTAAAVCILAQDVKLFWGVLETNLTTVV